MMEHEITLRRRRRCRWLAADDALAARYAAPSTIRMLAPARDSRPWQRKKGNHWYIHIPPTEPPCTAKQLFLKYKTPTCEWQRGGMAGGPSGCRLLLAPPAHASRASTAGKSTRSRGGEVRLAGQAPQLCCTERHRATLRPAVTAR